MSHRASGGAFVASAMPGAVHVRGTLEVLPPDVSPVCAVCYVGVCCVRQYKFWFCLYVALV